MRYISILFILLFSLTSIANTDGFYSCKADEQVKLNNMQGIMSIPLKIGNSVKVLKEQNFDISIYKGKRVVFLVSATWCEFCKYDIVKTTEWRSKVDWPY